MRFSRIVASSNPSGADGMLLSFASDVFAFFLPALAVDAELGNGASLQTGDADFFAAIFAQTIGAIVKTLESCLNLADQTPFTVTNTECEGPIGFSRSSVCGIGKKFITVSQVLNGRVTLVLGFFQHAGEQGAKVFDVLLFQMYLPAGAVSTALLTIVRGQTYIREFFLRKAPCRVPFMPSSKTSNR